MQYDQATKTTYNYTLDFPRGNGVYNVFAIPDDDPTGRLLASIPATPAYIHRWAWESMSCTSMMPKQDVAFCACVCFTHQ